MTQHTPCGWAPIDDPLYRAYHDEEWGVPEYDARALWEKLQLDGMQAGLAWITILRKRETMREEFDEFDPEKIARWDQARIDKALTNFFESSVSRAVHGSCQVQVCMRISLRKRTCACSMLAAVVCRQEWLCDSSGSSTCGCSKC